jgi:hypothetical protein
MGISAVRPALACPRFGFKQVGIFRVFDELFPEGYFNTLEGLRLMKQLKSHKDDLGLGEGVVINVGMKPPATRGEKPRLTALLRMGEQWNQKFIEAHGWLGAVKDAWLGHVSIIEQAVQKAQKRLQQKQQKEAIAFRWF